MGIKKNKIFIVIVATDIATDITNVATVKAKVATGCARYGNVKAEVTTDTTDVATVAALGCSRF